MELKLIDPRFKDGTFKVPHFATEGSAGIDLVACLKEPLILHQGFTAKIPAGIAIHISDRELVGKIYPRSSTGHKLGLVLSNGTGVIDSDYQGEIQITVVNRNPPGMKGQIQINPGDRIAQMLFERVVRPEFVVVDEFSEATERGDGGYGSTGSTAKQDQAEDQELDSNGDVWDADIHAGNKAKNADGTWRKKPGAKSA